MFGCILAFRFAQAPFPHPLDERHLNRFHFIHAQQLSDLFRVFDSLERGVTIALAPEDRDLLPRKETLLFPGVPPGQPELAKPAARLGVCSSGSTGRPKLIWLNWCDLAGAALPSSTTTGWIWASSFSPDSFAGVQVALQAWRSRGAIVSLGSDWRENWDLLLGHRVTALSCTPTFLDLLLQFEAESTSGWTPVQITLGGEVLRRNLGRRFSERFPTALFTVIYASAEHGVLLKTHRLDGWYEVASLRGRTEWRLKEDILEIRKAGEWSSTGDQVEMAGDLIRIVGRADSVANVGGTKVSLDEISRLAEEVPGVRRAVAFARPSAVVGQIVGLKFALDFNQDPEEVQSRLETYLRANVRKEAWPRMWEVGLVGLGSNSKRVRH